MPKRKPPGGMGESTANPPETTTEETTRADLALWSQALAGRWPMGPRMRVEIMKRAAQILEREGAENDRYALNACKVLLAADKLNLQDEALQFAKGNRGELLNAAEILSEAEQAQLDFDRDESASGGDPSP